MNNKRYPEEFKVEAVKQVTIGGHSVADVAKRLGTSTHSLYAWIKRYGPDSEQYMKQSAESAEIDLSPKIKTMTLMRFPVNLLQRRSHNEEALQRRTNYPSHQRA